MSSENIIPIENTGFTTLNTGSHAASRMLVVIISAVMMMLMFTSVDGYKISSGVYPYTLAFLMIGYMLPSLYLLFETVIYFKINRLSYEDSIRDDERSRITRGYPLTYEDRIRAGVREDAGLSPYIAANTVINVSDDIPPSYQSSK